MIEDPEVKHLEEKLGRSIFDIPLKEVVSIDANILAQRVLASVLRGAWDEAGFWRDLIRVEDMGNNEKMEVPIITMRDFKRVRGTVGGASKVFGGGQYTRVGLDVSKENTDYYVHVAIKERDIELGKWDQVDQALQAAGARAAKDVLSDITKLLAVDATGTTNEALGANNRFVALTNLEARLVNAGFTPELVLIESLDYAEVVQTQAGTAGPFPFLQILQAPPPAPGNQGLVGSLFGKYPVYRVGNDSNLAGTIVMYNRQAAAVLGLSQDITMVDFIDPIKDLRGFRLKMRYDLKAGLGASIGRVTGA